MLYLECDVLKVIVLETANLEELKKGHPAHTPDKSVLIVWTPDMAWLAEEIKKTDGDAEAIGRLLDAAAKRPEKPTRPYEDTIVTEFTKHKLGG